MQLGGVQTGSGRQRLNFDTVLGLASTAPHPSHLGHECLQTVGLVAPQVRDPSQAAGVALGTGQQREGRHTRSELSHG